jgi:hypothetical protein
MPSTQRLRFRLCGLVRRCAVRIAKSAGFGFGDEVLRGEHFTRRIGTSRKRRELFAERAASPNLRDLLVARMI